MRFRKTILISLVAFALTFVFSGRAYAAVVIAKQLDGSASSSIGSGCNNACSNVTFGSQVFTPTVSANLGSIEVFTANFGTSSRSPDTNGCYLAVYDQGTGALLAQSDNGFSGFGCAGDLTFSFMNTQPLLEAGGRYRWDFVFGTQNFTGLTFLGSPVDTVGGAFNVPPVVNAKFIALGGVPGPATSTMRQFQAGGTTDIAEGGVATGLIITFSAIPQFSEPLELQVEVRPAGVPFTGMFDGGIATSTFVRSQIAATVSRSIPDGLWHWRARFADAEGNVSRWTEFGTPGNTDFTVRTVPPPGDVAILAEQPEGTLSAAAGTSCNNACSNITVASQVFLPLRPGRVSSIEIFTADFGTQSANPDTNSCGLRLFNNDTGELLASSDDGFNGFGCGGDLVFRFASSSPALALGVHYRWDFYFGGQNFSGVRFLGSPNNVVDGLFSPAGPVVNAKFTVRSNGREPVVIVPGVTGSYLDRVSDGVEVWPNVAKMFGIIDWGDHYLDDLKMDREGNQTTAMVARDIIREVRVWPVHEIIYKNLIDRFVRDGYTEGKDLFVAPYDWRRDLREAMATLGPWIAKAIAASPNGKINIIAHSMGGLLVKQYLAGLRDTAFVDKLVLVGVPELGAPKAFNILNNGDDLGMRWIGLFGLNPREVKSIAQNMPAIYELLPSRRYIADAGGYVEDKRGGADRVLGYEETARMMANGPPADRRNAALLRGADLLHQNLDGQPVNASTVYAIVGCLNPTLSTFVIEEHGVVRVTRRTGDGTVPAVSAMSGAGPNEYFVLGNETGIDHIGLVRDGLPLAFIEAIIQGSTSTLLLPQGISAQAGDCMAPRPEVRNILTTIEFSTHSPVELHVYDPAGRHTGRTPDGNIEVGIPGSAHEAVGENTFILVPASSTYRVIDQGLARGTFQMDVKGYAGSTLIKEARYDHVPLAGASTTARLDFTGFDGDMGLKVDRNGDGVPDFTVRPTGQSAGRHKHGETQKDRCDSEDDDDVVE